ncbi:hypothetical protein KIL84_016695 [Mauremys mutica]|uniref:Uncharacterized protein n=1 Tax=Mauremys mutica TaxID=74926 RepID=A0A9D3X4T9_9SAUR|nr:hypothetical protein KIL84_016695 [Mauremys mutica]
MALPLGVAELGDEQTECEQPAYLTLVKSGGISYIPPRKICHNSHMGYKPVFASLSVITAFLHFFLLVTRKERGECLSQQNVRCCWLEMTVGLADHSHGCFTCGCAWYSSLQGRKARGGGSPQEQLANVE